ncbi:addiction module protein [Longimicrobium sp.]|uniref:addiction module protein n=1 Tax=Longimicrobium sp. TaxID=2029185 RepID=UPI002B65DB79|nr:addiction module protein [Longimicrobium sp.]HSU17938.1 addiction module protein [Longimicrobium sp.]
MGTALHHEMTIPLDQLEAELFRLPREERARLADLLAESVEREIAEWWDAESTRRYEAFLRGEIEAVDAREALARLRAEYTPGTPEYDSRRRERERPHFQTAPEAVKVDGDANPGCGGAVKTIDEVAADVLSRPREERERLAEALIASLRVEPAVEAPWNEEIRRRIHDIDSGKTKLVPGDDVLREAEELLR